MSERKWLRSDVAGRLKDLFREDEPASDLQQAYREAASVLATFRSETLNPVGGSGDPESALKNILDASEPVPAHLAESGWTLTVDARRRALKKLIDEGRVEQALAANPKRPRGPLQETLESYLLGKPVGLERIDSNDRRAALEATLQVSDWLHGIVEVPDIRTIQQRVEMEAFLKLFRDLVGDLFAGRDEEMDKLTDYVGIYGATTMRESVVRGIESARGVVTRDPMFIISDNDGCVLYWNKGAERLYGWSAEEAKGRHLVDLFHHHRMEVSAALASVSDLGEWTCELSKCHKDGRIFVVESRSTLLRGADGSPRSILTIDTDITDRKAAAAETFHLAFYDFLTDLPNRMLFRERIEEALKKSSRHQTACALMLIDLDDFKTLNDTAGHDVGDILLKNVAQRIVSCVRKADTTARLGGDEFVVMLEGLSGDVEIAAAESRSIGDKILRACQQPFHLDNYDYEGTTSIGVTVFRGTQNTGDQLFKQADLAMYRAKSQGRNAMCFFDPAMEASLVSRATLLSDLKRALQNREFELHYQPQLDSVGRVTGAEALLRWPHPQRGMVPPNEFIPLAESAGLINSLGYWVLETACQQLASWAHRPEMERLDIAVNVSIRQFQDSGFVPLIGRLISESGVNPERLKLEITESFMMERANETIVKMAALKEFGIGFSMDDFGTGYSSLSQLKKLPLDQLKIDQSFVRDLLNGEKDASILCTIIALANSLNLSLIAEGVETPEQCEFLRNHGCYRYQGYLFSPALPASRFELFVEKTHQLTERGAPENSLMEADLGIYVGGA